MKSKVCSKCKVEKLVDDFYKSKVNKDGRKSWCKRCEIDYSRQYQKTERGQAVKRKYNQSPKGRANQQRCDQSEKGKARHSRYNKSKKGKATLRTYGQSKKAKIYQQNYGKQYRQDNPHKAKARDAVNNATQSGGLPKVKTQKCVRCNKQAEQYHHYLGYEPEHWLNVQPVCISCHRIIEQSD